MQTEVSQLEDGEVGEKLEQPFVVFPLRNRIPGTPLLRFSPTVSYKPLPIRHGPFDEFVRGTRSAIDWIKQ